MYMGKVLLCMYVCMYLPYRLNDVAIREGSQSSIGGWRGLLQMR